jgi:hypothetical protein
VSRSFPIRTRPHRPIPACSRASRWALLGSWLLFLRPALGFGQSNLVDEIPPLRPPRAELPPSFWEQNQSTILLAVFAGVLFIVVVIWFFTARRPAVVLPPEVVARQGLENLRATPEDGLLLSRVSRILRRYLATAFELPPGESTTTEFCAELAANERIGSELANDVSAFLRRCDERKFAPSAPAPELGAVAQSLKLVEAGEARRTALRAAASTSASHHPA